MLVLELRVRLVGRVLPLERPLARVLTDSARRDDQHLASGTLVARREDHAADARVERQLRQLPADRVSSFASSTAPSSRAAGSRRRSRAARRLEEREVLDVAEASDFMRRITAASDERRISGSVNSGGAAKSSSS